MQSHFLELQTDSNLKLKIKTKMAKKKQKIKQRKQKIEKKKSHRKETWALILALVAIAFLLINSIYLLIYRDKIISEVLQDESLKDFGDNLYHIANSLLTTFVLVWFVLAVIMSFTVYYVEKGKWKWYWLLLLSIISLLTMRIDTTICGIVASLLYIKR